MREFDNSIFTEILGQVSNSSTTLINTKLSPSNILGLKYSLTKNGYYAVIVDDYSFDIRNKEDLLEALYYQVRLINVYDLNWDAIQEGMERLVTDLAWFKGICLLFKTGSLLQNIMPNEIKLLTELSVEINEQHNLHKIKIIINEQQNV